MSVDEAIAYLRRQARDQIQTLPYSYVLDAEERLVGTVSYRQLFAAASAVEATTGAIKSMSSTSIEGVNADGASSS